MEETTSSPASLVVIRAVDRSAISLLIMRAVNRSVIPLKAGSQQVCNSHQVHSMLQNLPSLHFSTYQYFQLGNPQSLISTKPHPRRWDFKICRNAGLASTWDGMGLDEISNYSKTLLIIFLNERCMHVNGSQQLNLQVIYASA